MDQDHGPHPLDPAAQEPARQAEMGDYDRAGGSFAIACLFAVAWLGANLGAKTLARKN